MNPAHSISALLPAIALLLPGTLSAENSKDFGQYVVHYNALATDMLPPQVARKYDIRRSRNSGMINVTVLKKVLGSPGQPVHAHTEVSAQNLAGQSRNIQMREIREGNAIYYIGVFKVAHEETLKFDLRLRPQGTTDSFSVQFSQDFFTR